MVPPSAVRHCETQRERCEQIFLATGTAAGGYRAYDIRPFVHILCLYLIVYVAAFLPFKAEQSALQCSTVLANESDLVRMRNVAYIEYRTSINSYQKQGFLRTLRHSPWMVPYAMLECIHQFQESY